MSDQHKAPLTTTTSIWPAAAVMIAGAVMLVVFMLINIIADQGVRTSATTVPVVVGGLDSARSNAALALCLERSLVPANVRSAYLVPVGTSSAGLGRIPNSGAGDFDCYQPLTTSAAPGDLLGFYAAHLEANGWNLFSKGSSTGQPQSLFQKAGTDGFYWVVGVTITSSTSQRSDWTFRIYQNSQTI